MKTNNNQKIHDMHIEDWVQVENFNKIGFEVGVLRKEYVSFCGTKFGELCFYIKSAGIYFPISKESAEAIRAKMARLSLLKRGLEEMEEGDKEK